MRRRARRGPGLREMWLDYQRDYYRFIVMAVTADGAPLSDAQPHTKALLAYVGDEICRLEAGEPVVIGEFRNGWGADLADPGRGCGWLLDGDGTVELVGLAGETTDANVWRRRDGTTVREPRLAAYSAVCRDSDGWTSGRTHEPLQGR